MMSGTIGVPANDAARYTVFYACLAALQRPVNTQLRWAFGSDRIRARNNLVSESLEVGSEWMFFLDDDHAFPNDLLMRLLAHEEPIVSSLYLQRMAPMAPVAYTEREDDDLTYRPLFLHDYPVDATLVPIRAAGTGGMVIRSEVFRELEEPWFEHGHASEDLIFCEKAREAGFPIYCDLSARLGHVTASTIWPTTSDDAWAIGLDVANLHVAVPIATREELAAVDAAQTVGSKA